MHGVACILPEMQNTIHRNVYYYYATKPIYAFESKLKIPKMGITRTHLKLRPQPKIWPQTQAEDKSPFCFVFSSDQINGANIHTVQSTRLGLLSFKIW